MGAFWNRLVRFGCHAWRARGLDRRGSVMPLVALSCTVLIGSAGLAVDGARLMLMHARLQTAIDAAGLSAVARLNSNDLNAQVDKFTRANFLDGYVGAQIVALTPSMSADEETLTVTARASADTTFMRILGINEITTEAETRVTRAMGGLELALILDVTGSMSQQNKIGSLKTASKTLIEILFGDDATVDKLHVGIVPFSQTVNIGTSRTGWLTGTIPHWKGCVEARFNGRDVTDDPPSVEKSIPYNGADCPVAVTPLTSTKATLIAAIDDLEPGGYTHIAFGAAWGWNMLSPRWKGLWNGTMGTTLPLDYGTRGMSKAAIIMTDGENVMEDGTAYGRQNCTNAGSSVTCSYDSRLNATATRSGWGAQNAAEAAARASAETVLDTKLTGVCTAMKNAGITVYTVALGSPGTAIENRLKACASQNAYFFNSPTGAALQVAFAKIGDSLSSLRVSR